MAYREFFWLRFFWVLVTPALVGFNILALVSKTSDPH